MPSTQRPSSPLSGRVRLRVAAALPAVAWTWAFWARGGVSLGARSHLLILCSLALLAALWPGRGSDGQSHGRVHWLSGGVGLGLYVGALWAPVIQLPTWILALLAWATWQVGLCVLDGDRWLRRALPSGLLAVCLAQSLVGLWQAAHGEVVRGTLGNPNHFAGAMALAGGLVAGWCLWGAWWVDGAGHTVRWKGWTGRGAALATAVLLLTVVVLGQSRGGLAVLLAVWGLAYLRWRSAGDSGIGGARALGLMLWGGAAFALTWWVVPRFVVDGLERRLQVYGGTLELIADHPWGVGPGLYRWLFRPYQRLESNKFFDYAHNDYLQLVAEWGWAASGLLLVWLVVRLRSAWHLSGSAWHPSGGDSGSAWHPTDSSWVDSSRAVSLADSGSAWRPTDSSRADSSRAVSLAVVAAVTAPLLHAWIDFDLHIPVLLMAVAALLAWTATRDALSSFPALSAPRLWLARLLWLGMTVLAVLVGWRVQVLAHAYDAVRGSGDPVVYEAALGEAPDAPSLHFGLALLRRDVPEHRRPKLAYEHLQEAVRLNPHSWRYRFELGRFYEQMGRDTDAAVAYGEALRLNPWEADDQRRIAGFYLRQGTPQGKALGRAMLAQSAAEDRRLLRAGGELLLASGHGPRELVVWWPRDGASQPDLLAVLCGGLSGRSLEPVDLELLDGVWRRWLDAADEVEGAVSLETGDVFPELLWRQGRGAEARRRWLELLETEGQVDGARLQAYRLRRDELWNGDFETPLRRSTLSWRAPVAASFTVSRVPEPGVDGRYALLIDFDGTPKLDFKRLRQQLVLEPRATYELVYHLRTEGLEPSSGLALQILDVTSRQLLWRGDSVMGSLPWRRFSGRFEVPPGDGRAVLRLARGPHADDGSTLDGRLWLDGLILRRLDGSSPEMLAAERDAP